HLSIDVRRGAGTCVLVLRGELDRFAVPLLEGMMEAADDRADRLVLDLAGLTFMDCHGARAIAQAVLRAGPACPVIVRSLSPAARRTFRLLGLELQHRARDGAAGPAADEQLRRAPDRRALDRRRPARRAPDLPVPGRRAPGRRAPGERRRPHRAA